MFQKKFIGKRFFSGLVRAGKSDKSGLSFCLVDCFSGQVAHFNTPKQLALATFDLCSVQKAQPENSFVSKLEPPKQITSEIPLDDWEDVFASADASAERGDEESMELDRPFMIAKRGDGFGCPPKQRWRKTACVGEGGIIGLQNETAIKLRRERRIEAVFPREPEEIEREGDSFGPFFTLNDFTENVEDIPEHIRQEHCFLSHSDIANAYRLVLEERENVFNPKPAFSGPIDPGCQDDALSFEDHAFMTVPETAVQK